MRPLALGLRAPYRLKRTIALLAQATLNLDFTRGGPLDSRVTFSRASGGTSFRPVGRGANLIALDFANWGSGGNISSFSALSFTTSAAGGMFKAVPGWSASKLYVLTVAGTATSNWNVRNTENGTGMTAVTAGAFSLSLDVTQALSASTLGQLYLQPVGACTISFTSFAFQEITLDRPGDPIQLVTAPANVPRFDYDPVTRVCKGLLIEEQRTNLLTDSVELHTWSSSGSPKFQNVALAPDGTMTADSFVPTAAPGHHEVYKSLVVGAVNALATSSIFVKQLGSYTKVRMADTGNGTFAASFDLVTGAVSNTSGVRFVSAGMEKLIDGWWRCHVVQTSDGTATARSVCGYPDNAVLDSYGCTYTGDGVSGVLVWGAQFEPGAFPTSYIPTSGAAATRAQDVAYIATAGWLNTTVGTMLLDFNQLVPPSQQDTSAVYFGAYPTTALTNGEDMGYTLYAGNNFLTRNPVNTVPFLGGAAGLSRIALALDGTGKYAVRNGGAVLSQLGAGYNNSGTPTVFSLSGTKTGTRIGQHVRRVAFWTRRMSNLDLIGLTR